MTDQDFEPRTRPSLLLRIRDARDDDAWRTFLETYAPAVYRYCCRKGLQHADATDVTQEVMAQVARSAREFDYRPERGRFRDWLGIIAHNKLANHLRAGGHEARPIGGDGADLPEPAAPGWPGSDWAEEFDAQVLRTALARTRPHFEPETWSAFERVWIDQRSAAEAARELAVPIDVVYVAKSRVLKRLREEVLALAEDLPLYVPLT